MARRPQQQCNKCERIKTNAYFYRTRGKLCIGCCMVEKYNETHKPEDPLQTRDLLIEKWENRKAQLIKSLQACEYKLDQLI